MPRPAAIIPIVTSVDTRPRPTVSNPNMPHTKAAPVRISPRRSNLPRGGSRKSWMNSVTASMPSIPTGMLMKNVQRQLK